MKTIVQAAAAGLVSVLMSTADAFEPGVYATTNSAKFIFTAKRTGAVKEGDDGEIGTWKQAEFDGKKCVVLKTWASDGERDEPNVWVFEETGGGIRPCGRGRESVENALANGVEIRKARGDAPELSRLSDALTSELEKGVNDEVAKFLRRRKAYRDKVEAYEFGQRLLSNPDELLRVDPEYPNLDSDEDRPGVEGMMALYPMRMRVVLGVIGSREAKFGEKTLLAFLDKIDWDKGDLLAFLVLRHEAFSQETLRKYASKVFSRFGKSDDRLIAEFFTDKRVPTDVLEAARKLGGYGEQTAKAIDDRLTP